MPDYYSENAERLVEQYRSVPTEVVHRGWLHLIKNRTGAVCDIGAASGRDADWFARKGWDVLAVEPEAAFRKLGEKTADPQVRWLNDSLPDMKRTRELSARFDVILLSAVWMHIPPTKRKRCFRILANLLAPSGFLVISLKNDSEQERLARGFFETSTEELKGLGRDQALQLVEETQSSDALQRQGVTWTSLVFQLPDDGTGSLPLINNLDFSLDDLFESLRHQQSKLKRYQRIPEWTSK